MGDLGKRRWEPTDRDRDERDDGPHFLVRARHYRRRIAGDALLQQQFGRLHAGVGMEALDHAVAPERVGDREQDHPLVVRHIRVHHHADRGCHRVAGVRAIGATPGVVDGVDESVLALEAVPAEAAQVVGAGNRVNREGQRRRIRGHHHFVAEPAFHAKPRNTERLVLVLAESIDEVVGGFRNAPRHADGIGVGALAPHDKPARVVQQRFRRGPHQQQGHEVLEQGRAPREQHR